MKEEDIKKIAEKYNLTLVVLFGSQATGKTHKNSDMDIAVRGGRLLDLTELIHIQADFCDIFGRSDVEVVDIQTASPILLRDITQDGKVLHSKTGDEFAILRMYASKLFVETQPLRDYRHTYLEKFIHQHA